MTTLYLIRHAQASFGSADYDRLSELGHRQAQVLGEALRMRLAPDVPLHVFHGDMRRQRETAQGCLAVLERAVEAVEHAGFNEFDHDEVIHRHEPRYADYDVMRAELLLASDPHAAFQRMFEQAIVRWAGGRHDPDYSESWSRFQSRCWEALQTVARSTPADATALVFTSGGTLAVLCQQLLGMSDEALLRANWRWANAGITKLTVGKRGMHLVSINEHAHLESRPGLLTFR